MKTFDIAKEYLNGIDFLSIDTHNKTLLEMKPELTSEITKRHKLFEADENNRVSNDHYRGMVFSCCCYHLSDIAHKRVSFFDVACEIIEANKYILKSKYEGFTKGSIYPKVMVDKFEKYCNEMNPQPPFLNDKSELRLDFFMCAFHYIVDKES